MKLLYILLILTLLFSCKVKRNLFVQTEHKSEQTEQRDSKESENIIWDSSARNDIEMVSNKESEAESETVIKIIEYDTSKPLAPLTGRPPVLRETESTTRTRKKDKKDITGKLSENSNAQNQSDRYKIGSSSSMHSSRDSHDLKQSENKTVFKIHWLWIIIGACSVLAIGICLKKKINPIKWFS